MKEYPAIWEELEALWEAVPADLVFLRRLDSTNRLARTVARELARDGIAVGPSLLLAWEQTAGRGRRGRAWISPPGLGIYATLLVPVEETGRTEVLPLLTGVALCRAVDRWTRGPCRLKWPNDLLVEGRKIGGILIETTGDRATSGYAVLGFGVNHGHTEADLPVPGATSLRREAEEPPPFAEAVATLAGELVGELRRVEESRDVIDEFRALSAHRQGDRLTCRTGSEEIRGRFVRFTDEGFLVLETGEGERTLTAAEVL